jgi:hypothetical protein
MGLMGRTWRAHDRRLRRRLALAAPLAVVVAVTFAYVLFVR